MLKKIKNNIVSRFLFCNRLKGIYGVSVIFFTTIIMAEIYNKQKIYSILKELGDSISIFCVAILSILFMFSVLSSFKFCIPYTNYETREGLLQHFIIVDSVKTYPKIYKISELVIVPLGFIIFWGFIIFIISLINF